MIVCRKNLYHAQEFQKWAHNKSVKPGNYVPGDKVWLNSKYIKTKQKRKLEAKFFELFQVLYLVGRQAYKLELPRKLFSTCYCWSKTLSKKGEWKKII